MARGRNPGWIFQPPLVGGTGICKKNSGWVAILGSNFSWRGVPALQRGGSVGCPLLAHPFDAHDGSLRIPQPSRRFPFAAAAEIFPVGLSAARCVL